MVRIVGSEAYHCFPSTSRGKGLEQSQLTVNVLLQGLSQAASRLNLLHWNFLIVKALRHYSTLMILAVVSRDVNHISAALVRDQYGFLPRVW